MKNDTPQYMAISTRNGKVVGDMPSIIYVVVGDRDMALIINDAIDVDVNEEV